MNIKTGIVVFVLFLVIFIGGGSVLFNNDLFDSSTQDTTDSIISIKSTITSTHIDTQVITLTVTTILAGTVSTITTISPPLDIVPHFTTTVPLAIITTGDTITMHIYSTTYVTSTATVTILVPENSN